MADPNTGNSLTITEAPDLVPHIQFSMNNLEQVKLPDIPEESRRRSDIEKDHAMRERFGPHGPGELLNKSSQQMRRDMLQEQQDVDGLPWEVRWRRALIPTSEEIVQDIRDRFDLYVQDPMDREHEWYLHWKDRGFRVQRDRMIWPQGYTDYLDHYDELGRRRVLPTDQRWSDSSWKHLADTQYRDRMWLIEGEERTAIHRSLQSERVLIQEEEERQLEMGNVLYGLTTGVVDLDPDQTYQALAGTADPMEVARTKMKLQAYGAGQALEGNKATNPALLDPISGFPKADMEPLGSGLTVEQGAALLTQAKLHHERFEQRADASTQAGKDPTVTYMTDLANASKGFDDRPALRAQVEGGVKTFKRLQEEKGRVASGASEAKISKVGHLLDSIEAGVKDAVAGKGVPSTPTTKAEGFIPIGPRPVGSEPNIPNELSSVPRRNDVDTMPEWYRISLVDTEPLIQSYRMVADPLEMLPGKSEYYVPPEVTLEGRITEDDARSGVSAFDEMKMHKLRSIPELTESFKPLPLFRETSGDGPVEGGEQGCAGMTIATLTGDDGRLLKKSERLRRERQERLRKAKVEFDPDILLPSLPWETDSIVDPYRGVEKGLALANFNKNEAEKTWRAYRDTFKQALTEYGNLAQVTNEARCEAMLYDTIERFRRGEVGDHPSVPEEQEAVYKLLFEGHTKHFLADFYKIKGNRATEANTLKAEGDGLIRQASSKSKLLGKAFMDFIQEMTSLELDAIRKCPVQRHAMLLHDKKYEVLAKPFSRWIQKDLADFTRTDFQASEQLETHREFLIRLVNGMRDRLPMRLEGIPDAARDATVEALFQWCRGAISFYCGQQLHRMYLHFAETRFRSRAEQLFEESFEYFSNYHKVGQNYVQIPIPNSEPPYEYEEKEFLDGESAVIAELTGNLEKAEGIWHSGSTKRWYPLVDETEYILFNERRGRLTLALDMSDRCLENVNKKTHPSIHPFPERARIFLEGAPLTQETAEHLWLRYMGDLYSEHSELMTRQGRFQTGRAHREKSLKLYHLAIRTARERLPPSWRAPLLTEAHYRMRCFDSTDDVATHVEEVEVVVEKLFVQKEPRHWLDLATDLPHRVALVQANLPAYGELITKEVIRRIGCQPSNELLMKNFEQRAQGGPTLPELESYMRTSNEVAEKVFRQKILRWRAKEVEDSDPYLFWTYLYFTFCVYPNHHEEVQKLWDMYEPAFLYIYTHCALALPQRGQKLINEALRRLCQILLPGNTEQRKCLLAELTKVREKMAHLVDTAELDRTIVTLVDNLADPRRPAYVYGTSLLHQEAIAQERLRNNPLLRSQMASRDYAELQERVAEVRRNADTLDPHRAAQMTEQQSFHRGDTPLGSQPDLSTKQMFEDA